MKQKTPSLQKALPRYYFLVLFITLAILLIAFYIYYIKNLRVSEYQNLQNICDSALSNMEQEIEKMSTVSLNTIIPRIFFPESAMWMSPVLTASRPMYRYNPFTIPYQP